MAAGFAARKGEQLKLSLWATTRGFGSHNGSLTATLLDGNASIGSVELLRGGTALPSWQQLSATLVASEACESCRLQLRASDSGGSSRIGVAVTVVSLFPQETFLGRPNGLRADVAGWLHESKPAFVRAPGGCFVEGRHLENGWAWKKTLGPIETRPGHDNDVWGYWTDDGLGMFELLQMSDDVGARPLLVVNAGCSTGGCVHGADQLTPYVQDALDAVEYVTGASSPPWGARRAAAGRVAPYELQALAIGNENCKSDDKNGYAANFVAIAKAVHARYPSLPLVIGCESQQQLDGVMKAEPAIATLANLWDVHQRHTFVEHARHGPIAMLQHTHEFDAYPRTNQPKVFVSEYSSPRGRTSQTRRRWARRSPRRPTW